MVYLDNAATTPINRQVLDILKGSMDSDFANSGTTYSIGLDAKKKIEQSKEDIFRALDIPPTHKIIFTSGGSEANNLFIKGRCFPDKKVAYLGLEHPSVTEPLEYMRSFGNNSLNLVSYQLEGRLDLEGIPLLFDNDVRLLCLSHVNNELGTINNPRLVFNSLRKKSRNTRLFMDGVQAINTLKLDKIDWAGLDGYSISAHKIYGPKGIGLLVYNSKLPLEALIHGGNQQDGVRSGTLPVPLIRAMAKSLILAAERVDETNYHLTLLNKRLIQGLNHLSEQTSDLNIHFNSLVASDLERQSPSIVNFSFPPVEGEVILHHLEKQEIFVGIGSACSAASKKPSKILRGIGLSEEEARCSLRISFSQNNTIEEVDLFLKEFAIAYRTLYPSFQRKYIKSERNKNPSHPL